MGCYGLGVTRILHASLEVLSQDRRLRWPGVIAPYQVCIIPQKVGRQAAQVLRWLLVVLSAKLLPCVFNC